MRAGWFLPVLIAISLMGLTVATYWPVFNCSFVNLDDVDYVIRGHNLLGGLSWSRWKYAWTSFVCNNWHPLTILSLGLDDNLWGLNPVGYHATNLAFHCLNVLLIFLVLKRMTGCLIPSGFVAALFAVHPLHVESVAWVSERKDVLSTFFLLLTIGAYVKYASRPSLLRYALVFALMTLGLLSKPMLVTLPILLLLLDAWPLYRVKGLLPEGSTNQNPQQTFGRLILEKIPLFGLSLADGLITFIAQDSAQKTIHNLGLETRIAQMFYSYYWYLEKTLLPINLIVFYPHPQRSLSWFCVAIGVLTFASISLLVLWQIKSRPHLMFGWAWFVITLLPVIGIIQVGSQAYADRYAYIPHIGLFVAFAWELFSWADRTRFMRITGSLAMIIILGCCSVLSNTQASYWKSSETLWTHALEVLPDNGVAHNSLGIYLVSIHKYKEAIPHFDRGIKLTNHGTVNAYCKWAESLEALDRPAEAEQKLQEALKINPDDVSALRAISKLLHKQQRFEEAEKYYAAAVNSMANTQLKSRQLKVAKQNFRNALKLNPALSDAHFHLAVILEIEDDRQGARRHFAEAYRINPQDLKAKQHMERLSKP